MSEERKQQAIDAMEAFIAEYVDEFAPDVDMPVCADWCLVVAHDSACDPCVGGVYRLNRRHQATYRSAGLLQMAVDDYRGVTVEEE